MFIIINSGRLVKNSFKVIEFERIKYFFKNGQYDIILVVEVANE